MYIQSDRQIDVADGAVEVEVAESSRGGAQQR